MSKQKHVIYRDVNALFDIYNNASSLLQKIIFRVQRFSKVDDKSTFLKIEMLSSCSTANIKAVNADIAAERKNFPYRFTKGGVLYIPSEDSEFNTYITSNKSYPIVSEGGHDRLDFYAYLKNLAEYTITQELMARESMEDKKYMQDIGRAVQSKVPLAYVSYRDIGELKLNKKTPDMTNKSDLEDMVGSFTGMVSADSSQGTKKEKREGTTSETSSFSAFKPKGQIPFVDGKPVSNVSEYLDGVKEEVRQTSEKKHRGRPPKKTVTVGDADFVVNPTESAPRAVKKKRDVVNKPPRAIKQTIVGKDKVPREVKKIMTSKDSIYAGKTKKGVVPVSKKESGTDEKTTSVKPTATSKEYDTNTEVSIKAVTQEVGTKKLGKRAKKAWYEARKEVEAQGTESEAKPETSHKSSLVSALQESNQEVRKAESMTTKDSISDIFKVAPQSEQSIAVHPKPEKEEKKVSLPPAPVVKTEKKEVTWSRLETVEYKPVYPNIPFKGKFNAKKGNLKGVPCLASLDDLDEAELLRCYPQLESQIKWAFYSRKIIDKQSLPEDSPELVYADKNGLRFTKEERFLVSLANSPLFQELYKGAQLSCRVFETPTGIVYEKYNQFIQFCNPSSETLCEEVNKYPAFSRVAEDHELFKLKTARWGNVLTVDELFKLNILKSKALNYCNRVHQFVERQGFFLESICYPRYTDLPIYMFLDEEKASKLYKERGYFWSKYYLELLSLEDSEMGMYPTEVVEVFKELRSKDKIKVS